MRKLYKYPWIIISVITVITVFFAWQLPKAELDNNNFRFVPADDPALETARQIDDVFGSSFFILVGLERPNETIFDKEFLDKIKEYSDEILEISIVEEDKVTSLLSADYIYSKYDFENDDFELVSEKLVDADYFSGTKEEIAELKNRLLSWDMYDNALYSDDFTATQILIPLKVDADEAVTPEVTEKIKLVRDLAHEYFSGLADVYVTGMPVIVTTVNEAMGADLKLLVPLVVLVVLLILFFSFRKISGVILPLITVLIATIWAVGAMPIFDIKLSVISTVLPVILAAVGSAYGIHVVTHYYAAGASASRKEHFELILSVIKKIRKPVFLAALTTFVGFASFCFTSVVPCREFGYFSSFGVAAAFTVAITLIPALLIIRGPGKAKANQKKTQGNDLKKEDRFSGFLANTFTAIAARKKIIIIFTIIIAAVSVFGSTKLIIDNVMIEYFRHDTDIYQSDLFIRRQFGGSKIISVVAEAESSEIILHPDTLYAMDRLSAYLQNEIPGVGKVMGFTDLVKRINEVLSEGDSYYEIPYDPQRYGRETKDALQPLISQYLVLLEGDISAYADNPWEPAMIKSTVQMRTTGMSDSLAIVKEIERYAEENFSEDVNVTLGGAVMVENSLNKLVVQSQVISMLLSIICVFIIIALSNKSIIAGFIGIIPLSISILLNFAVMGFLGIKLNLGTSMVAAVAVGVGIDYTIHCLEAYKREYKAAAGKPGFLHKVFSDSGKAIIINAVSVGAGFAVLLFSSFVILSDLGLLIALTMVSSALASLIVLPALLAVIKPKFIKK